MGLFIPPRANSVQSHCVNHTVPPLKSSYSASQLFQTIMKTCLISLFKYFFVCFEKFNWQIESLFICLPTDGRKEQHSEHPCTPYLVSPIIILPHPLRLCMCKYIQHISLLPNHPKEVCRHDTSYPNTSACTSLNRNILWNYNTITTKKINMDLMTSSNLQSVFSWKCLWQIFLKLRIQTLSIAFLLLCPLVLPTSPPGNCPPVFLCSAKHKFLWGLRPVVWTPPTIRSWLDVKCLPLHQTRRCIMSHDATPWPSGCRGTARPLHMACFSLCHNSANHHGILWVRVTIHWPTTFHPVVSAFIHYSVIIESYKMVILNVSLLYIYQPALFCIKKVSLFLHSPLFLSLFLSITMKHGFFKNVIQCIVLHCSHYYFECMSPFYCCIW